MGLDDLAATVVGGVGGLAVQGGIDAWHGHYSGWRSYVAAGVSGAAAGEAALYTGPAGAGAVGGFTHAATDQLLNGEFKPTNLAVETAGGAIGGKVLSEAGSAIAQTRAAAWVSERAGAAWESVAARVRGTGSCSFAEATPVTTSEGLKPIGELKTGDHVLARNEETGFEAFEPITGVFRHQDPVKVHLTLEDPVAGATEIIETTPEHPFHVPGRGFVPVASLKPDDTVSAAAAGTSSLVRLIAGQNDSSKVLRVKALTFEEQSFWAYNLEVGKDHTFFVGTARAWVHNICPPPLPITSQLTRDESNAFREEARDIWQTQTGRRAIWDDLDVHHRIPLEYSHLFPNANPNRIANLIGVGNRDAPWLVSTQKGVHESISAEWAAFGYLKNPTAAEVMREAIRIDELYSGFYHYPK